MVDKYGLIHEIITSLGSIREYGYETIAIIVNAIEALLDLEKKLKKEEEDPDHKHKKHGSDTYDQISLALGLINKMPVSGYKNMAHTKLAMDWLLTLKNDLVEEDKMHGEADDQKDGSGKDN